MISRIARSGLLVFAGLLAGRAFARPVALVLDDATPATRRAATAGVSAIGGRVVHTFDGILVAELPAGSELHVLKLPGVREVALNAVAAHGPQGSAAAWGLAAWNAIVDQTEHPGASSDDRPIDLQSDGLMPPTVTLDSVRAASRFAASGGKLGKSRPDVASSSSSGLPYGATELNTSEFLAGAVSVNVILVESDGTIELSTENWTADRESEVISRIAAGLEWVRVQEPRASLRFVYHVISGRVSTVARTGYEPIRHPADPNGTTGEDLWVTQILGKMGYTSGDRFVRSRALASDTRRADGTDWGVNVFVVDSLNDVDGAFADGRFAYTWIGGPHVVMTYDNKAWGIGRMDQVFRHELQHAFWAFDEYSGSGCSCTDHRGYLDGANANCMSCNAFADACVMISDGDAMCDATRRQIGWADLDGDGDLDVVGEDPDTFLDPAPSRVCTTPPVAGLATVVAATNRNPSTTTPRSSISVNRIASVEVRADGSPWVAATPEDGQWGTAQERFHATLAPLGLGSHRVEARAIDDHGNVDAAPAAEDVVIADAPDPLGSTVRVGRGASGGASIAWTACAGAATYRVYRASTAAGSPASLGETAGTSWTDAMAGSGYYQVRPVDACGVERAD